MFTTKPNYHKLRTNLKLCVNRLKLLEKKKTEQALKARKEIADYIAIGKDDRARIRVEHIIREDYMVEAMEIIEMLCDLILARFGLIEKMTELDPGLETAIATIIWVTPRLSNEILELKEVTMQFVAKYGKEFGEMCRQNGFHNVHEKVIYKMNIASPPKKLIENYMIEIAKTFKISYIPDPFEDDIPNTGDLLDLAANTMPKDFPSGKHTSNQFSNNAKHLEASGLNLGVNNDPMKNFNNQFYAGLPMQGSEKSAPPLVPDNPPNSGQRTLTTQITWDNEELPQLPPYESVMRQPFNYPTVPTGNEYPGANNELPNVNNIADNPINFPPNGINNQPFSNDSRAPYPPFNENNSAYQKTMNNPSNPVPYPRMDRMGGMPIFPKFPELPGLPSVPTDSVKPASTNGDIDFEDLARRFEELKKKK